MTLGVKIARDKRCDARPIRSREKDSLRERDLAARRTLREGNSCQSCHPIFHFAQRDSAAFMSQAENQVRYSGLRIESVRIPYQNHLSKLSASEIYWIRPHRFSPYSDFSGGGNALRSLIRSVKTRKRNKAVRFRHTRVFKSFLSFFFFFLSQCRVNERLIALALW